MVSKKVKKVGSKKSAAKGGGKSSGNAKKVWIISAVLIAVLAGLGLQTYMLARRQAKLKIDMFRVGRIIPQGTDKGQGTAVVNFDGDKQDNLYFLQGDSNVKSALQKFTPGGESLGFYEPKSVEQMLVEPRDVVSDAKGTAYVLLKDGRIQVVSPELKYVTTIKTGVTDAMALGMDSKGQFYLIQDQINKVVVFTREGKPLGDFGAPGTKTGDLVNPNRLRVSSDDLIAVLERLPAMLRVKVFSAADRKLLRQFDVKDLQNCPPLKMGLNGDGLIVFNDAVGASGMLIYDIGTGKFVGKSQTTKDGEKFVAPGGVGANRWTPSIYLHTVSGLIKCVMPSGDSE